MFALQSVELSSIEPGVAILVVGLLSVLLWAIVQFRNPLAAVFWAFSVFTFVFSGLFNIGIELFWLLVVATSIMVVVGIIARWI